MSSKLEKDIINKLSKAFDIIDQVKRENTNYHVRVIDNPNSKLFTINIFRKNIEDTIPPPGTSGNLPYHVNKSFSLRYEGNRHDRAKLGTEEAEKSKKQICKIYISKAFDHFKKDRDIESVGFYSLATSDRGRHNKYNELDSSEICSFSRNNSLG